MRDLPLIIKPDEEESDAAEVYVDGLVNGNPYRFLLDTGASRSSLQFDDYTAQFTSDEKSRSSGVFGAISDDLITVSSIEVGPIVRQNVTITRLVAADPRQISLIGMDLLKEFCWHFRFNESRVSIGTASDETGLSFQPLFVDAVFHPYIDVQFEATTAKAVWDTGASLTVVDMSFIRKHPSLFTDIGYSTGTDASGTSVETRMFMMSGAVIDGRVWPPHKVAEVDFSGINAGLEIPMDLILGYSTWHKAQWMFDFPGKRWAVSKWLGDQ